MPSGTEVGVLAARKIMRLVRERPDAVLGLATGSSPLAIYAALGAAVREGSLDTSRVSAFALDEYVGIAADHPDIEFVRPCNMCPHMKRNTMASIRRALETMTNEVTIDPDVADRARAAVERMLAVGAK